MQTERCISTENGWGLILFLLRNCAPQGPGLVHGVGGAAKAQNTGTQNCDGRIFDGRVGRSTAASSQANAAVTRWYGNEYGS